MNEFSYAGMNTGIIVFVCLLVLFPVSATAQSDIDFQDGFEREFSDLTGSVWSSWSADDGAEIKIISELQYEGSQSLHISLDDALGASLLRTFSTPPQEVTISLRFCADENLIYGGAPINFFRLWNQNDELCGRFYYHTSEAWLQFDYLDGTGTWQNGVGTTGWQLVPGKWYTLRITYGTGDNASLSWYLNGVNIHSRTAGVQASGIGAIRLGQLNVSDRSTGNLYYDDIRVGEADDIDDLNRGLISFTYDDGHDTNWDNLKPILDEYGFRASFYAVTDYQEFGSSFAMTAEELLALDAEGHDIQSHSTSHADLTAIEAAELSYELSHSKAYLESLGLNIDILTLPYGRYNETVIEAAKAAGYSAVFTTEYGHNSASNLDNPWRILRIDAAEYSVAEIEALMDYAHQEHLWLILYYHAVGDGGSPGDEYPYYITEADMRSIFSHARDNGYDVIPANRVLTYPAVNTTPTVLSVSPENGSSDAETFSVTYHDADGHYDMSTAYLLLGASDTPSSGVYLRYDVLDNKLYLWQGSGWGSGATPGKNIVLSSDQVSIDCSAVTFTPDSANGRDAELVVAMDFSPAFSGTHEIHARLVDRHGADSSLAQLGSFDVLPGTGSLQVTLLPVQAANGGATWSIEGDSASYESGETVSGLTAGTVVTVTANQLAGWQTPVAQPVVINKNTINSASLTYEEIHSVTVVLDPMEVVLADGRWSLDGGQNWYSSGDSVDVVEGNYSLQVSDVEGYVFDSWSGDAHGVAHPLTISVQSDRSITALYSLKEYTVSVGTAGGGTTDHSGSNIVSHGGTLLITASADDGYTFSGWTGDINSQANPLPLTVTGDIGITPSFSRDHGSLSVIYHAEGSGVSYTIVGPDDFNNGNAMSGISDDVSIPAPTGAYRIEVTPGLDFDVGFWGTNGFSTAKNNSTGSVVKGSSHQVKLGLIREIDGISVGVSSTVGGTTDKEGFNVVEPGKSLIIHPQADAEYYFHGWRGDAAGEASPLILKPEKDKSVVAVFKPDGMLKTDITPETAVQAGAGWKLDGQLDWRPSGDLSRGIDPGTYQVVFKKIPGFKTPKPQWVTIASGATSEITVEYEDRQYGYLVVEDIAPAPGLPSRWRLDGETNWHRGSNKLKLDPGSYRIWFAPQPGFVAQPVSLTVTAGETATITPDYLQLVHAPRTPSAHKPGTPLLFNTHDGTWCEADKNEYTFGGTGAWPVAGDYDGDGSIEPAIWHPRLARWRIKGGHSYKDFGRYGDIPAPADFDGDGQTDPALYRPETGQWFILLSSLQSKKEEGFVITTLADVADGQTGLPLPADYLGLGSAQAAVYIPINSSWHIQGSSSVSFGHRGFVPAPGDYDGDGVCEPGVVNLEKSFFLIWGGGRNDSTFKPGDLLSVADFDGDGRDELIWYRPMQRGAWNVLGRIIMVGGLMDIPATP